jgi:membrane protein
MGHMPAHVLARKTWAKVAEDELMLLAMGFAYLWLFAIPALLILIVMMAALVNNATDVPVVENLRTMIHDRAPVETRQLLLDQVDSAVAKVGGSLASIGALTTAVIAIWSSSSAMGLLLNGFNRAYEVKETRSMAHRRALTIGLTILIVVSTNAAFGLLVYGERVGQWISGRLGLGEVFDAVWSIARWPIAIFGIMLVLAILYWCGPNVRQSFRWVSPCSIVATLLWLGIVAGFGLYLTLANPGSTWGVLGSVIVLLVFLNFSGIAFFLGAEVNAVIFKAAQQAAYAAPHLGQDPLPLLVDG